MSDYKKLLDIIHEIDALINENVESGSPHFRAWHTKAERFLIQKFGEDSKEYNDFHKQHFSLPIYTLNTPDAYFVNACKDELIATKAIFSVYLNEMESESEVKEENKLIYHQSFDSVFIVHGHDGELKEAVARLLEKQNIKAIILHEQTNQGKTIIEKLEKHSDVGAAICLFTADDEGKANEDTEYKSRARQNVVFEAGYFMGKLGRDRTIIIADNGVEMLSDMSGVVYTDSKNWQLDVLKELNAMGYKIDLNHLLEK